MKKHRKCSWKGRMGLTWHLGMRAREEEKVGKRNCWVQSLRLRLAEELELHYGWSTRVWVGWRLLSGRPPLLPCSRHFGFP